MRIYIVEDDLAIINILEDIIETQNLGEVCGDCGGEPADILEVLRCRPDVVLVDSIWSLQELELPHRSQGCVIAGFEVRQEPVDVR